MSTTDLDLIEVAVAVAVPQFRPIRLPLTTIDVVAASGAHVLPLLVVEVVPPDVSAARLTTPTPTPPGERTQWDVLAVDMDGNVFARYPTARVDNITEPLDMPRVATFAVPIDAPGIAELPMPNRDTTPTREVQIYRNGHLEFWGPVTTRRANSRDRVYNYTAQDPLWYFTKRYMGESSRHNYLRNGSFATDLSGWYAGGDVSAERFTAISLLGGASLRMQSATSGDNFYGQRVVVHTGPQGRVFILTGWLRVDLITDSAKPPRGLFIQRLTADGGIAPGAAQFGAVPLDKTSPLYEWQRFDTWVLVPPNSTEVLDVRLYCPKGVVYWDAVTVTVMESLSFIGVDQCEIAQRTVAYLGGRFPVGSPYTKSDLRVSWAGARSGKVKDRTYQFADHQRGDAALQAWNASSDGFDFRVVLTPSARIFKTYYPAAGRTWDMRFVFVAPRASDGHGGSTWCITGWDYGDSIEGSASDITEMGGWGTGAGREDGSYNDVAAFGGLTLELVESAPSEATIDQLALVAAARGVQLARPIATPILTMAEPRDPVTGEVLVQLIGVLKPGDLIPVLVLDGDVSIDGLMRVTSVAVTGDDVLTVTIAP